MLIGYQIMQPDGTLHPDNKPFDVYPLDTANTIVTLANSGKSGHYLKPILESDNESPEVIIANAILDADKISLNCGETFYTVTGRDPEHMTLPECSDDKGEVCIYATGIRGHEYFFTFKELYEAAQTLDLMIQKLEQVELDIDWNKATFQLVNEI